MRPLPKTPTVPVHRVDEVGALAISPPLAVGNILELRMFCQLGDQGSVNVRPYRISEINGTGAAPGTIISGISLSVSGNLTPLLSVHATYRGSGIRRVNPKPPSVEYTSASGAGPGLVTGDPLPRQCCGMVTFLTAFAGRGYRGRIYIPFPGETSNDTDGTPVQAYLTALGVFGSWLINDLTLGAAPNTTVLRPIIWHREDGTFTDVTGYQTRIKWATQRKRGSYGRPNESPV